MNIQEAPESTHEADQSHIHLGNIGILLSVFIAGVAVGRGSVSEDFQQINQITGRALTSVTTGVNDFFGESDEAREIRNFQYTLTAACQLRGGRSTEPLRFVYPEEVIREVSPSEAGEICDQSILDNRQVTYSEAQGLLNLVKADPEQYRAEQ